MEQARKTGTDNRAGRGRSRLRAAVRIAALVAMVLVLHFAGGRLLSGIEGVLGPLHARWGEVVLYGAVLVFALFLSLPFVPGMEIGLAVMMLFGVKGVALVYFSTLLALSLSFVAGRLIPLAAIARLLAWLHLTRAAGYVARLEPLTPGEKLDLLVNSAPVRTIPFLLRHRYVAIAIVLNVPGNWLIGGGGGIGLLAGVSRLFHFPRFLLAVAVAIAPLPLMFLARATWPLLGA